MEKITDKYIKGFNDGYILKEHKPQLTDTLLSTKSSNDYILGLRDGVKTYEQTKVQSRTLNRLNNLRTHERDNRDQELEH